MRPRRRRLVVALAVGALVLLAGCDGQPRQTEVVCEGCVDGVEEAASTFGHDVRVTESVTHLYLDDDGGGRVEARMSLAGGNVSAFRTDETLLRRTATLIRESTDERRRPAFERRDLSADVEGDTLVVTYRVADVAERRAGGTVLSAYFYRADGEGRANELNFDEPYHVETDRFVVHGPPGTSALVEPPGATARDGRVVWTGDTISTRSYLVFGPAGTSEAVGRAVIGLDVLGWAGPPAFWGALIPAAVLLALTALFSVRYTRLVAREGAWYPDDDPLCWVLCVLALAAVLGLVGTVVGSLAVGAATTPAVLVVGAVGYVVRRRRSSPDGDGETDPTVDPRAVADETGPDATGPDATGPDAGLVARFRHALVGTERARRRTGAVVGTLAVVLVATAAVALDYTGAYAGPVGLAAAAVPFVGFPLLGWAVTDRSRSAVRAAVVTASLVAPWVVTFGRTVANGIGGDDLALFAPVWAVGAVVVGTLLFYGALWASTR